MSVPKASKVLAVTLALAAALAIASCGGGSSNNNTQPPPPVNNTVTAEVNAGPAGFANMLFVSVTVCMPGSTTNCQKVDNIQVDTGSEGLRILSSALGSLDPSAGNGLPVLHDTQNNQLQECIQFADTSYVWGPVATADVSIAGETASSVPIQVIAANPPFPVPTSTNNNCLSLGNPGPTGALDTVAKLGANGIIGLGNFPQDCGGTCATVPNQAFVYFVCPAGACTEAGVPTNQQVSNPVIGFASDNNGILITMPSIPAVGTDSVTGSIVFGIGTQNDNALANVQVYTLDGSGNMASTPQSPSFAGVSNLAGFLDTGSTGIYYLDHATLGIPDCADAPGLYCPTAPINYTVTNTGANGTTGNVTFTIANADALFNSPTFFAFNDLGGDSGSGISTDTVDLGMPFFYNRSVFVGIAGQAAPASASGNLYGYFAF